MKGVDYNTLSKKKELLCPKKEKKEKEENLSFTD